jgi:hypothetical protein
MTTSTATANPRRERPRPVARVEVLSSLPAPERCTTDQEPDPGRRTLVYPIDGAAAINGVPAASDDAISRNGADSMAAEATAPTDLLGVSVAASPCYEPRRHDSGEAARCGVPGGPR